VPLVPFTELLARARSGRYAVGYFEAWDGYSLDAVIRAAELEQSPVIVGFGCLLIDQEWLDRGGIEILALTGRQAADRAGVPLSLLLNEAHTLEHGLRGIESGFGAVMLATSDVEANSALVRAARTRSVAVEGELGSLPDGDSLGRIDDAHATLTDPDAAAAFVAATGVDALAVSIGNVHTLETRAAAIDLDRLEAIRDAVDVPLVIHGGTGFPADKVAAAIERGVAKFNVGTVLKRAFVDGLRAAIEAPPEGTSPHDLVGSHRVPDLALRAADAVVEEVRSLMRLYGSSGRAAP
jgi:fructose-bisphosphate aldolase class II